LIAFDFAERNLVDALLLSLPVSKVEVFRKTALKKPSWRAAERFWRQS
jgi:hypothetical protein